MHPQGANFECTLNCIIFATAIDPTTGTGTETDGGEVNLPQTGFSVVYNYIMLAAMAMVLFGIFAMVESRKEQDAE